MRRLVGGCVFFIFIRQSATFPVSIAPYLAANGDTTFGIFGGLLFQ
jgi:hypothetical protein